MDAEALRASRAAFWDDSFSARLVGALGAPPCWVDVGCGLGHAARELVPRLPGSAYFGVDLDGARLSEARRTLSDSPVAERARFVRSRAEALPFAKGSIGAVLTVMTLQHLTDVRAVIDEIARVLRPGGRLVAAEPDNLGMRFYADGPLDNLSDAVRALFMEVRVARAPADLAIGPRVAGMLLGAGFADVKTDVHAVHATRAEPISRFRERVKRVIAAIAGQGGLRADAPAVRRCEEELARATARATSVEDVPTSQVVPVFIAAGTWSP